MKWTDIRKLEVGDIIYFGNHMMTSKCTKTWHGKILHVTVRGGIKVRVTEGTSLGKEGYIPYHKVISFPRHQRKKATAA